MLKFPFRKRPDFDVAASARVAAEHLLQGRLDLAESAYQAMLNADPEHYEALSGLGSVMIGRQRFDEAAVLFTHALRIRPESVPALCGRGDALRALGRHDEAIENYSMALALEPEHVDALVNRGNLLHLLGRTLEAINDYDTALLFAPDVAVTSLYRGVLLHAVGRADDAIAAFNRALSINPQYGAALQSLAVVLGEQHRHEEELSCYERLVAIDPGYPHALGNVAYVRAQLAQWNERDKLIRTVESAVANGHDAAVPFVFLTLSQDPAAQLSCATLHAAVRHPYRPSQATGGLRYSHDRIRVAYVSADFRDHAMAFLMAGLLERHDRNQFEVTVVSLGADVPSPMQTRIRAGVERFVDVQGMSDGDIATMLRNLEIDIAVDLMGFTGSARTDIFASRSAPVQVNYLGFPGTMGADYIDYLFADRFVIPEGAQRYYTEKVVYLPDTFQANDDKRPIADAVLSRADTGLPLQGFVFCSFNNTYKITPAMFDIWMRLLLEIEGSVLWLLGGTNVVVANLRREAEARGVAPGRLVFGAKLPYAEHLARYRLADLFLDTLPFNAGTTASDALWAGLPVLTCAGEAFAARMAGSLLHAVGLPELVTHTLQEYEQQAAGLARNPEVLRDLRDRLDRNRLNAPLFDTDRFRQHVEAAYRAMWEISQRGEAPRAFAVESTPGDTGR